MKIKVLIKFLIQPSLIFIIFFTSCGGQNGSDNDTNFYSDEDGYTDGKYCAEIDYFYYETSTSSTYTLEVEIEDNKLTDILWPNGGRLDNSHFSPPDISDGNASFTSYRGVDYKVRIIGKEGDCSLDTHVTDEDDLMRKKMEKKRKRQEEEEEERIRKKREDDNE